MNIKPIRVPLFAAVLATSLLSMTAGAAQPAAAPLDRAALLKLADNYLAALAAKDPSRVPYASNVRIVEQSKRIKAGEGLWKTTTGGVTAFRIVVPDTVSQQVGGIVVMQSEGKPAQVGFRLKLQGDRIVEAEHMIAFPREQMLDHFKDERPAINMEVPYEYADSRGRLIHIAKAYYDALDLNNGSLVGFAADCDRRENGMRTAPSGGPALGGAGIPGQAPPPPGLQGMHDCRSQLDSQAMSYITTIDNRRVEIADEVTGLALGFSHFRHPMTEKNYRILNNPTRDSSPASFDPFDLPALHIYKIWGGQIHEIEAMGFMTTFNAPTGWE